MNIDNIQDKAENVQQQVEEFFQTPLGQSSLETANQLFKKYGADKYPSFASWWDEQMKKIQSNGLYNSRMTPLDIVNTNRRTDGLPVITTTDMNNINKNGNASSAGSFGSKAGTPQKFTIAGINGWVFLAGAGLLVATAIFIGTKFIGKKSK